MEGADEYDPISGTGTATIRRGGRLRGTIEINNGDSLAFVAERTEEPLPADLRSAELQRQLTEEAVMTGAKSQVNNALRRWIGFPIQRQGEHDYACGAYCVVSAAIHLGTEKDDAGGLGRVLKNIAAPGSQRMAHELLTRGTGDRVIRRVADEASLSVWRPKRATLSDLQWHDEGPQSGVWMALMRMEFHDPRGVAPIYSGLHYVLVLEVTARHAILADPHPWHDAVYAISLGDFSTAWDTARGPKRPAWAGYLYKSTRGKR